MYLSVCGYLYEYVILFYCIVFVCFFGGEGGVKFCNYLLTSTRHFKQFILSVELNFPKKIAYVFDTT